MIAKNMLMHITPMNELAYTEVYIYCLPQWTRSAQSVRGSH